MLEAFSLAFENQKSIASPAGSASNANRLNVLTQATLTTPWPSSLGARRFIAAERGGGASPESAVDCSASGRCVGTSHGDDVSVASAAHAPENGASAQLEALLSLLLVLDLRSAGGNGHFPCIRSERLLQRSPSWRDSGWRCEDNRKRARCSPSRKEVTRESASTSRRARCL